MGKATIIAMATDGSGVCASCEVVVEKRETQPVPMEKYPVVGTKITLSNGTIPATVTIDKYSYKVTAIVNKAFKSNKKIKSVKIGGNKNKKTTLIVPSKQLPAYKRLFGSKTGYKKL